MEKQTCVRCKVEKEITAFVKRGPDKYRTLCSECKNAENRERHREKHGTKLKDKQEQRESDPKRCNRCDKIKPLSEYNWQRKGVHRHTCKTCQKTHAKNYFAEGGNEVQRAYVGKNKEKYKELSVKFKKKYKESGKTKKHSRKHILKQYNLKQEDYEKLLESQDGKCAICGTGKPGKNRKHFCVDHCHKTNEVRGLLCVRCNTGLGHLGDTKESLQKALDYLKSA